MNTNPKVGEVVTYNYNRFKCVETNARQMGRSCETYCALGQMDGETPCGYVACHPGVRADGEYVHFVKMAPRRRRNTL